MMPSKIDPLAFGTCDIGQRGTTIKWKTTQKNTQLPQKYLALSIQQNTQLGVFKFDIPDNMGPLKWKTFSILP